jgi:hypothetical protein
MRSKLNLLLPALVLAGTFLGCESRTDKTDGGGVLLSVSDFDGLPISVSMNAADLLAAVRIDELTITSVVKDPNGPSGALMNVELESYEVRFQRADSGSRVPPIMVQRIFGQVPVNGTDTIENLPFMGIDQLETVPLRDLFFVNGGLDQETLSDRIRLDVAIRFFGRTLSGDAVETAPAAFTVDFVP